MIKITIPLQPITKKNSPQIINIPIKGAKRCSACGNLRGRPCIIPSKAYKKYEKDCSAYLPDNIRKKIDEPVNIKAIYHMQSRHRVDLTNLNSSLHDILVKYNVLKDDDCRTAYSTDGSYVTYDKENPRTEIHITKVKNPVLKW